MELKQKREIIAKLGGYELITNYPLHIWSYRNKKINSIAFDKPKNFSILMEIVDKIEQEQNLSIEIKRHQCIIKKQYLTHHTVIVDIDGKESKQNAIFEALSIYGNDYFVHTVK